MNHIETTHLIAQYLAAAGISFLEKKPDDSHTNLGFDTQKMRLETHPLNEDHDKLVFDYKSFCLKFRGPNTNVEFALDGATHQQVIEWVEQQREQLGISKPYTYGFHYDLPSTVNDDHIWTRLDRSDLSKLAFNRVLAQNASTQFANHIGVDANIRIWPHHFDTGGYTPLPNEDSLAVGWGMAIPDSLVDGMYFYISYYMNGKPYLPAILPELSEGRWSKEGFVGAVLSLEEAKEDPSSFFKEVHTAVTTG